MLVSDIIVRARDILADPDATRWSDTRLIRLVDEAQKNICSRTNILRTSTNIVVNPQQANYTLPSNILSLSKVYYNDTKLEITSLVDNIPERLGTPEYCILDTNNKGVVTLYPTPNFVENNPFDLAKANLLRVFYTYLPDTLSALTDTITISEEYKMLLVKYVSGNALREDMDTQNRQFGIEELTTYEGWINKLRSDVAKDFTTSGYYVTPYWRT